MKMIKKHSLFLLCYFPVCSIASDIQNWQLVLGEDPLSKQTVCLMISATQQTKDGQSSTPVNLIYNGSVFIVKTKSNIDLSYPGLGLQVGTREPHTIDQLLNKTNALFETQAGSIHNEFVKGIKARLTLGFWPSWPKTKSYVTEFNLHGFTKTYEAMQQCQETGELPE